MDNARFVENITFDKDISLQELLGTINRDKLESILQTILQAPFSIQDLNNKTLLGAMDIPTASKVDLCPEFEPIGYLITPSSLDKSVINAARDCLLLQLQFSQKFLMASALHIEAIQEDYETLCKEHEQLLESEARYKSLSEQLDIKVKDQVKTIETAQLKLFESEKMASIGHLAAGMAHEINNPIGFINSNLNSAKAYIDDLQTFQKKISSPSSLDDVKSLWSELDIDFMVEDFTDLLSDCIDGGKRIAEIVADLKMFSNVDAEEQTMIDLNKYLKTSCHIAESLCKNGTEINFCPGEIPPTECKPGYIGQVILALIMNTDDAIQSNGKIKLTTRLEDDRIFITAIDNGPGIPEEILGQVYDPFFTTKNVGNGKGLGLTACRDIVRAHNGDIEVRSKVGTGTTVEFWLPVIQNGGS